MEKLHCWRCGASLAELTPPIERRDECPACRAQLYVCRFCEFYEPKVARQCREPVADEVKDKERANFCGYFKPNSNAHVPANFAGAGLGASSGARNALEELFGKK